MGIVLLWIWGALALCWIVLFLAAKADLYRMGMGLAMSLLGAAAALAMIRRAQSPQRQ